jgi:photosystem II stability/assembly factor-like uncharacterized protein
MPVTIALVLLAALPIGQSPESAAQGPRMASRPNRHVGLPNNVAPQVSPVTASARHSPPADACLCDVAFIDPQHGWAVGDHGVILHTTDGGKRWSPQDSGVTCSLNSVCFVDANIGWAAGGMAWPYLHDTSGVVLATRDGGATWQRMPVLLPALHKIRFVTDRQGWAIGCSSPMYPSGVFLTRDGGRSWQPASSGGAIGLTAGDLYDGRNAVLGGSRARLATISTGDFARKPPDAAAEAVTSLRGVHSMQIVPPSYGWLVGDGGWIALTGDGGNSWRSPLGKLPASSAFFDFTALAVRGGKCWIAGSPGSRIFFTPDAGRTWVAAATGVTVPLKAIAFADDEHGWAVGQLGTILVTSDGGQTWQRQRAAGARAALMAVAGRAEDLPLELFARTCKDQGYFGVCEVIGREDCNSLLPDGSPTHQRAGDSASAGQRESNAPFASASGFDRDASVADRLHQAMLHVGACCGEMAWGFPVRTAALQLPQQAVLEHWNRLYDGRAGDALIAYLVLQIRTWRPDVLVIPAGCEGDGLNEIVRQSITTAVKLAGDSTYLGNQLLVAGCEPWNVQRVCLVTESKGGGTIALTTDDWSPRLGQTWTDAVLPARGLLEREYRPSLATVNVQVVTGANVGQVGNLQGIDVMTNIDSTRGGNARRPLPDDARGEANRLDGVAQRRQIEKVFTELEQDPQAFVDRMAKGVELPRGIDTSEAAALTFRIAERLYHSGHWELADKVFGVLLDRYSDDPLARAAVVWRLQSMVSDTLRVPREGGTRSVTDTIDFARQIELALPDLYASPAIRYPLAAAYRRQGQDAQAERLYVLDRRGVDRDTWWNCARGERWLAERKGPPPRPFISCPAVTDRPHLDGRLEDATWQKCTPIALTSPQGDDRDWPTKVAIAHDEKFLYVAVQCRQAPGARYDAPSQPRTRDPDLSQHDRVDIFLDIDRTYASYYHLTIDHRGWAADACCGDQSWNPKWFVAAKTADGSWTAEAAIPLAELGAKIEPGKTVWGLGIQRTVPGVGFQSWTTPAAPEVVPEGFGWLGFE